MNIQVIGPKGMLGQAVFTAIERLGHTHAQVANFVPDITKIEGRDIRGEVVINCAGLVKQRAAPASEFMQVNAYGPQRLAEACDTARARLIHVSTDCVFGGQWRGPHSERSSPSPDDIYSASKLAGEVTRGRHLTVRTSFVGRAGKFGLVQQLREQAGQTLSASRNALWSGDTVETVATALVKLAETELTGLIHIPGQFQSRPQLIQRISETLGLSITVEITETPGRDRRLVSDRWGALNIILPSFQEQLQTWTL